MVKICTGKECYCFHYNLKYGGNPLKLWANTFVRGFVWVCKLEGSIMNRGGGLKSGIEEMSQNAAESMLY